MTVNYRESYGLFASSSMGFNHESPRRGMEFVTRKVTHQVAKIKCGLAAKLSMGNVEAERDWGFAEDYVRVMWMMLQQPEPGDYVLSIGKSHSVRELLDIAFAAVGLDWEKYVEINPKLVCPAEVDFLCSDASRAREKLGWEPEVSFNELIRMMVEADMELVQRTENLYLPAVSVRNEND
jgi:GDPmannose 4,6-dehydratase